MLDFETEKRCYPEKINPRLRRLTGTYIPLDENAVVDFSDVISLSALSLKSGHDKVRQRYYENCRKSCERALGIPENHIKLSFEDRPVLCHLLRVRSMILHFQDEWGDVWEGDVWEIALPRRPLPSPDEQSAVTAAKRFYTQSADSLLNGIDVFDRAIATLLNWDTSKTVSYGQLRSDFQFPDDKLMHQHLIDNCD